MNSLEKGLYPMMAMSEISWMSLSSTAFSPALVMVARWEGGMTWGRTAAGTVIWHACSASTGVIMGL